MMYRTAFLAAASLTLVACAQEKFSTKMPEAVGLTDAYYKNASSTSTVKSYLRFAPGALTKIVFCSNGDQRVRVEVTAPARLTGTTIEILADARATDKAGDVDCVAQLEKSVMAYEIDENETLEILPQHGWRQHYLRAGKKRPHLLAELASDLSTSAARMRTKMAEEHEAWAKYQEEQAKANLEQVGKIIKGVKTFGKQLGKAARQSIEDAGSNPYAVPNP